jgi:hypothetical protein
MTELASRFWGPPIGQSAVSSRLEGWSGEAISASDTRLEHELDCVLDDLWRARQRLFERQAELRNRLHAELVAHQARLREVEARHAAEIAATRESAQRWARRIIDEARADVTSRPEDHHGD